ncbi:DUF6894 family protein [Methylobacterium komagatae]
MARYYFDVDDGTMQVDEEGIECATVEHARGQTMRFLPDLAREQASPGWRTTYLYRAGFRLRPTSRLRGNAVARGTAVDRLNPANHRGPAAVGAGATSIKPDTDRSEVLHYWRRAGPFVDFSGPFRRRP